MHAVTVRSTAYNECGWNEQLHCRGNDGPPRYTQCCCTHTLAVLQRVPSCAYDPSSFSQPESQLKYSTQKAQSMAVMFGPYEKQHSNKAKMLVDSEQNLQKKSWHICTDDERDQRPSNEADYIHLNAASKLQSPCFPPVNTVRRDIQAHSSCDYTSRRGCALSSAWNPLMVHTEVFYTATVASSIHG